SLFGVAFRKVGDGIIAFEREPLFCGCGGDRNQGRQPDKDRTAREIAHETLRRLHTTAALLEQQLRVSLCQRCRNNRLARAEIWCECRQSTDSVEKRWTDHAIINHFSKVTTAGGQSMM